MIIERKDGKVIVWNSKLLKTEIKPTLLRLYFNRHSNEIEFCDGHYLCEHYSIEELESMIKYLKKKNKELIQK
jgi:hypothetical protein